MTAKRIIWAAVVLVIALPPVIAAVFIQQFDPNAYAPRLVAAVQSATGRQLLFGSPIRLIISFTPTIEADNVSLANPSGFSDPKFLTLSRVEARIALFPLFSHRVDIRTLVLEQPNVILETNQAGQADWDFSAPSAAGAASPPDITAPRGGGNMYKFALESVEIQNGLVTAKNASGATTGSLTLTSLKGDADTASAPLNLAASAAYNGAPFTLNGQLGPVERFSGIGDGPWPIDLTLAANNATAVMHGFMLQPRQAKGYDIAFTANVPTLEAFSAWFGDLPPIHNLTAAAHLTDQDSAMPAISDASIKTGVSDLSGFRAGLALTALDIEMPSLNQPVTFNATGTLNAAPVSLTGSTGPVAQLLDPTWFPDTAQPAPGNFPIGLQAQAAGAKFSVTGGIATPTTLSGVALGVTATVPDLSALSALAGTALPAWKNINVQTTIIDPGGLGLTRAAGLDSLTWTMEDAAFGGDASMYFGVQPKIQIALKGQQIDVDALYAAIPNPPPTTTVDPTVPPAPAQSTAGTGYLSVPLDPPILKTGSADIQLAADSIIFNNATYTALQGHAVLANGVLTINPFTAVLPGGSVAASATLDNSKDPAAATIAINAPALALAPFLKSLNLTDTAEGTVQGTLNASGTGDTPRAMLASVNGQFGLAAVNGVIDGAVLDEVLGAVLNAVDLPAGIVGAQGLVAVRCFGLRVDASNGTGTIRALTLDSSRLMVEGGGTVNFADGTLGLILRPQMRIGGNEIGVPVQIAGPFASPTTAVAPISAVQDAAKAAAGLPVTIVQTATDNSVLGGIAQKLGLGGPATATDVCPAALSLARLGNPGPAAPPPISAEAIQGGTPDFLSGPKNLLNSLLK